MASEKWVDVVSDIRRRPHTPHGRVVMAPDFVALVEVLDDEIRRIHERIDRLEAGN